MLTPPEGDQIPSHEPLVLAATSRVTSDQRLGPRSLAAGVLLALAAYIVMLGISGIM